MEDMEKDEVNLVMEKKENKLRLNMRSKRINTLQACRAKQGTILSTVDY